MRQPGMDSKFLHPPLDHEESYNKRSDRWGTVRKSIVAQQKEDVRSKETPEEIKRRNNADNERTKEGGWSLKLELLCTIVHAGCQD